MHPEKPYNLRWPPSFHRQNSLAGSLLLEKRRLVEEFEKTATKKENVDQGDDTVDDNQVALDSYSVNTHMF